MSRPRVLLADDHKIVTEGIRTLLACDFDLVGSVEDGRALLAEAKKRRPDVIVADISMPLLNGIEAAHQLREAGVEAKIIFLTMHPEVAYARRALEVGASGYVLKHSAPSELITAIREALKGQTYVTPMIARELTESSRISSQEPQGTAHPLTRRQREVLQLLAEGHSAKKVAEILNISRRTAEFHKYRIMDQLNLNNSAELIHYAMQHGIVEVLPG